MGLDRDLKKVIGRVGELPAMPEIVGRVLALTEDPNVPLSEVSDVVEQDPSLAAKILKISNSPYYGMKQVVGTLKLALVILGVREVRNIVLGISVMDSLRDKGEEPLPHSREFWNHSVTVAALTKKLASLLDFNFQGEDFISGLLHDIGKMVLARQLKDEYKRIYKDAGEHSAGLCRAELEAYGFDHGDAAAVLAQQWNLPETLGDALWLHHARVDRPLDQAKDPSLAALVRVANLAVRDDWKTDGAVSLACAEEEAWTILFAERDPMDEGEKRRLFVRFFDEFKKTPVPSF